MASALTEKFGGKKRAPKFQDEGPPSGSDDARGSGSGVGDDAPDTMPDDASGDPSGADSAMPGADSGTNDEEKSVDDLSDILGVGPEDRQDFANALKAYVNACLAGSMGPSPDDMMGGAPPMGGDAGGAPGMGGP